MNQQIKNRGYRWQPGQSGNPAGRPVGARQKIVEPFIESLRERWERDGDSMLDRLVISDPGSVLRVIASLMPKDVAITVEQRLPANLEPSDWALLMQIVETIKANIPADANAVPAEVLTVMAEALRAHFARSV